MPRTANVRPNALKGLPLLGRLCLHSWSNVLGGELRLKQEQAAQTCMNEEQTTSLKFQPAVFCGG
jgi:hypothetical protein